MMQPVLLAQCVTQDRKRLTLLNIGASNCSNTAVNCFDNQILLERAKHGSV